ncbi:MAG: TrkH family potassium uptake protein, partial [Rhodobacteraceae bacterium]|nr:TrkH family potassium uptake protein [Paracoccaceae bacterium]MBL4811816.1 TrkH family potassium uptake protein [Paracoccaceae bacterium]
MNQNWLGSSVKPDDTAKALPLFVYLMGIGSAAMIIPAAHALTLEDFDTSRIFFYGCILGSVFTFILSLAARGHVPKSVPRSQLSSLLGAFLVLPALFAMPFQEAAGEPHFLNAWFEMVSCFTTTGATLYDDPLRLAPSVHLWRALVGWMGGLLVWVTAAAILSPMNLGGFEVGSTAQVAGRLTQFAKHVGPSERLRRHAMRLAPIYVGLTALLWIGLLMAGELPIVAISHAMSVLATSGISPVGGVASGSSGLVGEALIFCFFIFAMSRLTFSRASSSGRQFGLLKDPEMAMAAWIIAVVAALLFFRHFIGAANYEGSAGGFMQALSTFWGGLFTAASFLSTTGFESTSWQEASVWSNLQPVGLMLVGLALIGGGVATTAGGVKLLRSYALYKHGQREIERLIHPSSIGGAGAQARRIRREGAYISWIFFMLFGLSVAGVMLMLSFTGVQFETALVLAVSALSTTGPLASVAGEYPISYSGVPEAGRV